LNLGFFVVIAGLIVELCFNLINHQRRNQMMKLIRAGLMSAVMVVLMCSSVFAQGTFVPQGSITVPFMASWGNSLNFYQTNIFLSNITGSKVTCKITPYGTNGNEVTQYLGVASANDFGHDILISKGIKKFEIPAHSTRYASMVVNDAVKSIHGYVLIEWSSEDTVARRALIGDVRKFGCRLKEAFGGWYPLNNGQPF